MGRILRTRTQCWAIVSCTLAFLCPGDSPAQNPPVFRLIVHAENPVGVMQASEVSSVFLRRKATWDSGLPIEPIDLSGEAEVREAFSSSIHGRSAANIRSFWNQEVFSGRAVPPVELASSREVLQFVRSHPGAIGYVSSQLALDGVKVISYIVPPRATRRVEPNSTAAARTARASGDVILSVHVDTAGNVSRVTVVKELGYGLTREAVTAVNKWKFSPATRDGIPVAGAVEITLHFVP